jgi:hypothetical protein
VPVYLYAICDAEAEAPSGGGLHGAPLRMLRFSGLAALVSDQDDRPPRPTEDDLWEHETVIERLMSEHDLLPARFGESMDSDAAVLDLLHGRGVELRSRLRGIAGALELGIRAAWLTKAEADNPSTAPTPAGVAYLTARAGLQERARALADRVDTALGPLSREGRVRLSLRANTALTAAYLVARDQIGAFQARASDLNDGIDDAVLACTGPWPPYSFIEGGDQAR